MQETPRRDVWLSGAETTCGRVLSPRKDHTTQKFVHPEVGCATRKWRHFQFRSNSQESKRSWYSSLLFSPPGRKKVAQGLSPGDRERLVAPGGGERTSFRPVPGLDRFRSSPTAPRRGLLSSAPSELGCRSSIFTFLSRARRPFPAGCGKTGVTRSYHENPPNHDRLTSAGDA